MIAPAAFENVTFPDQKYLDWTAYESIEWMRVGRQYFTAENGVSYGTPAGIGTDYGTSCCKWAGGALALNGNIYGLGNTQSNYLIIDSLNDTVTTSGTITPSAPSSQASVYSPFTNCIYSDADDGIYKYDVSAGTWSYVSKGFTGVAIILGVAHDGRRIYYHGFFNQRRMYYYDILTDTVTDTGTTWTGDRLTGALSWNNKFFLGGGGGSTNFLVYDVATNTATTITGGDAIAADSYRNFIQYFDGYMYTFGGYGKNRIKRVDPVTLQVTDVYTMASTSYNFNDFTIGADGKIYCVGASNVLGIYDPRDNTFSTDTLPYSIFEGIVMGAKGDLYAIPWTANKVVQIPIQNSGNTLKAIQEYNGIISRHQAP